MTIDNNCCIHPAISKEEEIHTIVIPLAIKETIEEISVSFSSSVFVTTMVEASLIKHDARKKVKHQHQR